jgi:hypothetical protein
MNIRAQDETKNVVITACGSGHSLEDAKIYALRSATRQVYETFISSKAEYLNIQTNADLISSLSSGNVQSFEILNQNQLPNGKWGCTVKAIISVENLTNFARAKGAEIEFKGGDFAFNIKQQILDEQGEIKAITEMIGMLHEPMQISFDYTITSGNPISLDAESKNWEIPIIVTATCNKNMEFCANYLIKTIAAFALTGTEVEKYNSLNKSTFPVTVRYEGKSSIFHLRKARSIAAIKSLTSNWEFYTRLFSVQSGIDEYSGIGKGDLHRFNGKGYNGNGKFNSTINSSCEISFPSINQWAATYKYNDKRTLSQIEQMTGYSVNPRGIVSNFKHGGYVVFEKEGHGIVVSLCDIGDFEWPEAKTACDDIVLNGYNDWRLPSTEECELIFSAVANKMIGDFCKNPSYIAIWNSQPGKASFFKGGERDYRGQDWNCGTRPVRSF